MPQFTFEEVSSVVRVLARQRFQGQPDRADKLCDAQSLAWEAYRTAPDRATPASIAWYAVRRVDAGRQFRESIRSTSSRRKGGPQRVVFDVGEISRHGDNPADIASLRIDFEAWFATLTDRQRAMLELFLVGERTDKVADTLGCTAGRVSQYRRRLVELWHLFHHLPC